MTAKAATLTEADATISHVELTPYKYGGIQIWSAELDEDAIIEIEDLWPARMPARSPSTAGTI